MSCSQRRSLTLAILILFSSLSCTTADVASNNVTLNNGGDGTGNSSEHTTQIWAGNLPIAADDNEATVADRQNDSGSDILNTDTSHQHGSDNPITDTSSQDGSDNPITDTSPQHPLAVAADELYKYGMTILFIFGSVGNFLAIAVLVRKRMRNSSGSLYLLVLGIIDQIVIFTAVLGSHVIRSYTGFDWIRHHRVFCKLGYFIIVAGAQSAFYLVTGMSLERAIVVSNPLRHMHTFTRRRTLAIIAAILLVWMGKNVEKFWTMGAIFAAADGENGTESVMVVVRECGATAEYLYWSYDVRPWLDYVITFGAAVIIIVCNVIIIVTVTRSGRLQKEMTSGGKKEAGSKTNQMIPMLVTTSLCFLFLALPLQIVTIIWPSNPNDATTQSAAVAKICWSVALLTNYANNGVNFYVYCVSGRMFRQELREMFGCASDDKRVAAHSTSGNTQVSTVSGSAADNKV